MAGSWPTEKLQVGLLHYIMCGRPTPSLVDGVAVFVGELVV